MNSQQCSTVVSLVPNSTVSLPMLMEFGLMLIIVYKEIVSKHELFLLRMKRSKRQCAPMQQQALEDSLNGMTIKVTQSMIAVLHVKYK